MRNVRFWIALFMSIFAINTNAQTVEASFSCDDFEIAAGETKVVKVSMTSKEENIFGFQVRITIPEELSFAPVSGTGTRAKYAALNYDRGPADEGYTITTTRNMGDIKSSVFLSKNDDGYPYYGTSGVIFSFAVTASADIKAGSHNITFSEIEIVKDINVQMWPADFEVSAKVLPTSVTLNKTTTSIMEGNTETLIAKLLPGDVVAGTDVTWSTSDSNIAIVSNGVVTAVAVGEADVTVTTSNNKTATCKVTVTEDVEKTADIFKTDFASILGKTTSTVTSSDIDDIKAAIDAYNQLSDAAKAKLSAEKALLDALKAKAEELKAAEEADAAATAEANQFKTDNADILAKTTETVASSDIAAIEKALEDYSKLSDAAQAKLTNGEKALLDALKTKAEELKAAEEADATATAEANKFKTDNADILGKTTETVASSDIAAIDKALEDYSKLSDAAQAKLTNGEKALLDALKTKAEELKAAEEADAAATAEANKFKTDNANILGKTTETVASSDIAAIDKALEDYSKLSDAAQAKLTNGEKALLDALKTKAEELKAAEEADAATAEANKFKTDNANILGKNIDDITADDKDAVNKALEDYDKLSDAAKDKLTEEKADLDSKKEKVEAIITGISSINAITSADKCYNLNGQRTSNSTKGILIKNGKKIFVK